MAQAQLLEVADVTDRKVATEVWIEVRQGSTQVPMRRMHGDRMLIGAGSQCHCQLGGGGIPILHSVVARDGDEIIIDAVAAHPSLIVNGAETRTAALRAGDIFAIGDFEFGVHIHDSSLVASEFDDFEVEDLQGLTAGELIARIEDEQQFLDDVEHARDQGAAALLQAIQNRAPVRDSAAVERDKLLEELRQLSAVLDDRAEQIARREAECADRAARLMKVHDEIARQLHRLVDDDADLAARDEAQRLAS